MPDAPQINTHKHGDLSMNQKEITTVYILKNTEEIPEDPNPKTLKNDRKLRNGECERNCFPQG